MRQRVIPSLTKYCKVLVKPYYVQNGKVAARGIQIMSRKVQQGAGMNISTYNSTATIVHVIGALAAGGAERLVSDFDQDFSKCGLNGILFILCSRLDAVGNQMVDDVVCAGVGLSSGSSW